MRAGRRRPGLSGAPVGNAFVERVYASLAPIYDIVFGPPLRSGRVAAVARMAIRPGDHVLEVGVGTGLNAALYPPTCLVTGVDLSGSMLAKARERVRRAGLRHVRLLEMDAASLTFADGSFDHVYAPYLLSVVADPVAVVREMYRVCRPRGTILVLNHFLSENPFCRVSSGGSLRSPCMSASHPTSTCPAFWPGRASGRSRSRR